jgi:hypothetical protein
MISTEFQTIREQVNSQQSLSEEIMKSGHGPSDDKTKINFTKFTKIFNDDDCSDMDDEDAGCSTAASKMFGAENFQEENINKNLEDKIKAFYANFEDFSHDSISDASACSSDSDEAEAKTEQTGSR